MGSVAETEQAGLLCDAAADVVHPGVPVSLLLVCEHATNFIPREYAGLGLDAPTLESHIAWDSGARPVAGVIAAALEAPLVAATVSRLVYDLNRPPEDPSAVAVRSAGVDIPGNAALGAEARAVRAARYYQPFHAVIASLLDAARAAGHHPALVTLHSFTPDWQGRRRTVEVGILHDADSALADRLLTAMAADNPQALGVRRNQPYGPADGVTHTLRRHGLARGLPHVMIEIRNDLIATPPQQQAMGRWLARCLLSALPPTPEDAPMPEDRHVIDHA